MSKTKILMDISIFENKVRPERAAGGIYFMAVNILKEFLKRDDIELSLFARTPAYCYVKKALELIIKDKNIKLFTDSVICAKFNYYKSSFIQTRNPQLAIKALLLLPFAIIAKLAGYIFPPKYDAEIYFSTYDYPPYAIRKQKNLKRFIYLHDVIPILDIYKNISGQYFKKRIFDKLEKENFYFTNSEYTRQDFIKYSLNITAENSKTVYLAAANDFKPAICNISLIKKKYHIPDDKKYVFSLCTLEPRKNLIRIVSTFVEFIKKHNIEDLVFVMGGGQWEIFINELSKTINDLEEYKSKILKIGYVADEDLPALYTNAEWFIYTSQYEGFGLPPLEAMACKCPVIVSNATSLPEVVGDAGLLINYDSDEEHIQAYETYYYNTELKNEYADKGYERSKLFSYKKTADELLDTMLNSK